MYYIMKFSIGEDLKIMDLVIGPKSLLIEGSLLARFSSPIWSERYKTSYFLVRHRHTRPSSHLREGLSVLGFSFTSDLPAVKGTKDMVRYCHDKSLHVQTRRSYLIKRLYIMCSDSDLTSEYPLHGLI